MKNFLATGFLKPTCILLFSVSLAACGSGGGETTNGPETPITPVTGVTENNTANPTPTISSVYTGTKDPALLDQTNTVEFAQLVFGNSLESTPLTKSRSAINEEQKVLINKSLFVSSINEAIKRHASAISLTQRQISSTENCSLGGTLNKEGEIEDVTNVGTLTLIYNDCEEEQGVVLNGNATITTISSTFPKSSISRFNDLKITQSLGNFSITGNIESYTELDENQDKYKRLETRNIVAVHSQTNFSSFFENVVLEVIGSNVADTATGKLSGKIYLQDEGYVQLSSSDDFLPYFLRSSGEVIPQFGSAYLTGASSSKARLFHQVRFDAPEALDSERYRLDLDKDGDGLYELTSIQNYDASSVFELGLNQNPEALIFSDNRNNNVNNCGNMFSHNRFLVRDTIYLIGECSNDPENDSLNYQWTLESRPTGSNARLNNDIDSVSNSVSTDLKGDYTVSLKVTDLAGNTNLAIADFNIPNLQPAINILPDTYENVLFGQSYHFEVHIGDDSRFASTSLEQVSISHQWITKPAGSSAELTLSSSEITIKEQNYGIGTDRKYSIIPDVIGTYTLKFTVTDVEGLSSSETLTFVVN